MQYFTPTEFEFFCTFSRGRFSNDLETKLAQYVDLICEIGRQEQPIFISRFDERWIERGKTGANHRTEMTTLLGLTIKRDGFIGPSDRCLTLQDTQDFPMFFKTMCLRFQYPNCINASYKTIEQINKNVRFKPAQIILRIYEKGIERFGKSFGLNSREVGYFIFNDLRVTTGSDSIEVVLNRIIESRDQNYELESGSKYTQHSREFLNFMTFANLLREVDNGFILNPKEEKSIKQILNDESFFDFPQSFTTDEKVRREYKTLWQDWYGGTTTSETTALVTPVDSLLSEDDSVIYKSYDPKEIGDTGERIVYKVEKDRVAKSVPEKIHLVRVVSNDTSLGYDIQSINDNGSKRLIEVKTTKRIHKPSGTDFLTFFDMSSNEWETAGQYAEFYYIYRVFLTSNGYQIYVVPNPIAREEENKLRKVPLKYRIVLKESAGYYLKEGE